MEHGFLTEWLGMLMMGLCCFFMCMITIFAFMYAFIIVCDIAPYIVEHARGVIE